MPHRRPRQLVEVTAHQVAQGMAAEGVAAQQDDVEKEDQRADADAEMDGTARVFEPERMVNVVGEEQQEQERQVDHGIMEE